MIPGLGADASIFADYDFTGFQKVVIKWSESFENESLSSYARKLMSQIDDDSPIIIGFSFGGMIAVEIAKEIHDSKVCLVSSISSYRQISWFKRFPAASGLIRLVPDWFLTKPNAFLFWLFGVNDPNSKTKLSEIIKNTSPEFLKWAVGAIGIWKGSSNHSALYRIHGSSDRLLPLKGNADQIMEGGGHFMVVDKREEIEKLLLSFI